MIRLSVFVSLSELPWGPKHDLDPNPDYSEGMKQRGL